jgi:glyoxylase-like metal-dependent hydrolase (beta-lactamase superfamily II)
MFPELAPRIEKAIAKIGGDGIDFAINTHWHFDHAQGNLAFGPKGTWIVSQANSRAMMKSGGLINLSVVKHRQAPYPPEALPVLTFEDRMQFHFNGQQIDLLHPGPAHTTGDTAIIFRGSKAVHMGDVFNNTGYPFIDADSGGDIDGMIAFCRAVVAEMPADGIVIPGHGKLADVPTLVRYIDMLQTVRDRIAAMIAEGKTLAEVEAAQPTADFSDRYGDVANSLGFVDRVYTSLSKKR